MTDALQTDPNRHLSKPMSRHADSAGHATLEDLSSIDATLDQGLELVRLSLEEGLSGLHGEKVDALRTDIAFLRLRRGRPESDPLTGTDR